MKKILITICLGMLFVLAGCVAKTYTVTFQDWDGSVIKTEEIEQGKAAIEPDAPSREGYDFTGWDKEFSNITKDTTVVAQYSIKQYTVSFYAENATLIEEVTVNHGEAAVAPTPPTVEGKEFLRWDQDLSNVTSDMVVLAVYVEIVYTLQFVDWDGTVLTTLKLSHGEYITYPTPPTRTGYRFVSWSRDEMIAESDATFTAVYEVQTFKVYFYDKNSQLLDEQTIEYGKDAIAPTAPTIPGFEFSGWDKEFTNVSEHLSVNAEYTPILYTVTFLDRDNNIIKTEKLYYGSDATAPTAPTYAGRSFTGWSQPFTNITANVETKALYETAVYRVYYYANPLLTEATWANKEAFLTEFYTDFFHWIEANYTKITGLTKNGSTYTFTKSSRTATWSNVAELRALDIYDVQATIGTIIYKPFTRTVDEPVIMEASEDYFLNSDEYRFKYQDLDRYFLNVMNTAYTSYNKGYNANSAGSVQIFFRFHQWGKGTSIPSFDTLPKKYASNLESNKIVIPENTTFTVDDIVTISNPEYENITFLGWYRDRFGSGEKITTLPAGTTGDVHCYAMWDLDTTKHRVLFLDHDQTVLQDTTITAGQSVTAPTPKGKTGFIFEGWDKDFSNITSDITITARYGREKYTIIYDANSTDESIVLPTEPVTYTVDDEFVLPSATRTGYVFSGWYNNAATTGEKITKTTSGNLHLYAKWIKIPDGTEPENEDVEVVAYEDEIQVGLSTNIYVKIKNIYQNSKDVQFISLNPDIVSINEAGFAIGLKEGSATILIIAKDNAATIEITVKNEASEVLWVGHRGSGGPVVPNGKTAFELGGQRGYYALECDVRVSADNVYYICHDDTFLPYLFVDASLHNKVMTSYTWNQLKDLQIKNTYNGVTYYDKLATVEEYLQICKRYGMKAVIELKWTTGINSNDQSKLGGLVELVKANGMYEDAIFMTSMKNCLTYLREHYPDANLQFLSGASTTNMENINWCIENRISLDAANDQLTKEMVLKMHEAGLYVNAYTVNSQSVANNLIAMGVDMITTDHLGVK